MVSKIIKQIFTFLLLPAAIAFLAYLNVETVAVDVRFKEKDKPGREAVAIQRLKDIRTLQEAYKNVKGYYAVTMDSLKLFYNEGNMKVVYQVGTMDDSLTRVTTDALVAKFKARGIKKQEALQLPNLCLVRMDAQYIVDCFEPGEVERIYLNFSDPWPKDRHAERRLTSETFLRRYDRILREGGLLEFKTDNRALFDFSVEEFNEAPNWELRAVTYDLHNDIVMGEGNIMTEYERKFSLLGNKINKLIAVYRKPLAGQ
jgi:tRNA (guanine-N(7)-)-methyltransferase